MDYKYIFKYNEKGDLYNYVELDDNYTVSSYYYLSANTLTRYDKNLDEKHKIKYKKEQDVILKHRFEAGESWITTCLRPIKIEEPEDDEQWSGKSSYRFPNFYHNVGNTHNTSEVFNDLKYLEPPEKEKEILLRRNKIKHMSINKKNINKWSKILNIKKESKINYPIGGIRF